MNPPELNFERERVRHLRDELRSARAQLEARRPEGRPLEHVRRLSRLGWASTAVGYVAAAAGVVPLGVAGMSYGRFTRWVLVAHPVLHRSYDSDARRTGSAKWDSRTFARGWRRVPDWFDWFGAEGWRRQHNQGHHRSTGADRDPDRLTVNFEQFADRPPATRAAVLAVLALSWRWTYYLPAIVRLEHPDLAEPDRAGSRRRAVAVIRAAAPYALVHYVAIPLLIARFSPRAARRVLVSSLLAEVVTNIHSFSIVAPTHSASMVPVFDGESSSAEEYLVRQIAGSADYVPRNQVVDCLQGYMGYQIEHHIFPDLPLVDLPMIHDEVRARCIEHGLPWLERSWSAAVWEMARMVVSGDSQVRTEVRVTGTDPDPDRDRDRHLDPDRDLARGSDHATEVVA